MQTLTRLSLIFCGLVLFAGMASASNPRLILNGQGLLWKIERADIVPSYVYGTIHSEDARVLQLPVPVRAAFDDANYFVMEARLDAETLQSMVQSMMLPAGQSLKPLLSPALYAKAVRAMASYGVPEAATAGMRPWAVAITLSMPKPETGLMLDLSLMQQAMAQGKPTAGLETAEEQLGIFEQLTQQEQITMLADTLKFLHEREAVFKAMHASYLARDLARLMRISETQLAKGNRALSAKVMRQLIDERNRRMAARMAEHFKNGKTFVAIGALHLPGEVGVLNLLARQGYRVSVVY